MALFLIFHFPSGSISEINGKHSALGIKVVTINPGSSFTEVLVSANVSKKDSVDAVRALKKVYDVNKMAANRNVRLVLDDSDGSKLIALSFLTSNHKRVDLYKVDNDEFEAKIADEVYQKRIVKISSIVKTSLFSAVADQGVPKSTVMNLINICDNAIDLRKSLRASDLVELVFERFFDRDGNFITDGKILYASIKSPKRDSIGFELYHHIFRDGDEGYFDAHGRDMSGSRLSKPVGGKVKISSKFGWRTHPILGHSHFHRGVDFAAPHGTPIYAAGDGVVEFLGNRGGYGKYIKIKHSGNYATAYGHLSRFVKSLKENSNVKKGQLIAYSGSSGLATGPHLHYEVLLKNKPVDPIRGGHASQSRMLSKDELVRFRKNAKQLDSIMNNNITYASTEL